MESIKYLSELNEYAYVSQFELRFEDRTSAGPRPSKKHFVLIAVLNGKEYPEGVGKTKQEAKRNAAKNALMSLLKNQDQDSTTGTEDVAEIQNRIKLLKLNAKQEKAKQKQKETNFIGLVAHYCQKKNLCHSYIEERRCGKARNPTFFYKLEIDKKRYPEAEGKTVKEAKQNAARLAWFALQEQSDWDSKVSVRSMVSQDGTPHMYSVQSPTTESHESSSQSTSMKVSVRSPASEDVAVSAASASIPAMGNDESSSESIVFEDSSNPPNAQVPLGPTTPEHDPSTKLSAPTSLESLASSQSTSSTSGSGAFTDSSTSSKDQHDAKEDNTRNTQNQTSTSSRFTSEFEPMECLGSGGFGCVYKAKQKELEIDYAVKIVRCKDTSLREVKALSHLSHRNIIRYYTFWTEDTGYQWNISDDSYSSSRSTDNPATKYLYIQMELCDTKTLKAWIEEKNNESVQDSNRRGDSLRFTRQILSGVKYIHSENRFHRDLKPDNILFGLSGEVKIGDFGLVTAENYDDAGNLMERTGGQGTKTYMAPEQKTKNYDRKVDIFALGLIYFELLWKLSTGHERGKIWDNARNQKFPDEFSLTYPEEEQIIRLMLCANPEDRPEASALKAELEKVPCVYKPHNKCQENITDATV